MRNYLLLLVFVFFAFVVNAQIDFKKLPHKSHQLFAYAISAATAEQYMLWDSIPVDAFLQQQPIKTYPNSYANTDSLPIGHYVLIAVEQGNVKAEMINNSNLFAYPINNRYRLQIDVRTKAGESVNEAMVWVDKTRATYNIKTQNYWVQQRKPDDALVKVCTPGDTIFLRLEEDDDDYVPIRKQQWRIFKTTKFYKVVSWLPTKIIGLFKPNYTRYRPSSIRGNGFMVFSQPKYKLNDTVRLKAYVLDKKNKRYQKPVSVYLEYNSRNKQYKQLLTQLKPASAGAYVFDFVLRDTLVSDISYSVALRNTKGQSVITKSFKIEDYVLDEVATYTMSADKTDYFLHDTMHFSAEAKDANGLYLLDATAKLIITAQSIKTSYKDTIQVSDTLYVAEQKLDTRMATKFQFATSHLPNAHLDVEAKVVFKNSNNEIQEKSVDLSYKPGYSELVAWQVADTVYAEYKVNGQSKPANGEVEMDGDVETSRVITYPYKTKIDPFAEDYTFYLDSTDESETLTVRDNYRISLSRISKGDTLGFTLSNTYRIPVSYTIFKNKQLIDAGKSIDAAIVWTITNPDKRQAYKIKWQYVWANETKQQEETIGLLDKILNVNINATPTIYPGQKDTIEVGVKDYKDRPAAGVNLTAFSYNGQFKNDIRVPDPPYLKKYQSKPQLLMKKYESSDPYLLKRYPLGKYQQWRQSFGLDSMLYFKTLFPADTIFDVVSRINSFMPQVSVHVVKKGQPQQVFMLILNNIISYYYNTQGGNQPYSFEVMPGYTKVGVRLFEQYFEIDSIYVQPHYKHDLVIDLDKLPTKTIIEKKPNHLTDREISILEKHLFQLESDYQYNNGYVWQQQQAVSLNGYSKHIVGPFKPNDSLHLFAPGKFDIHFIFEPGYAYRISEKILRLEKTALFPPRKEPYQLVVQKSYHWNLGDTLVPPPTISYPEAKPTPYISMTNNYWHNNYASKQSGLGHLQLQFKKDTALNYLILYPIADTALRPIVVYGTNKMVKNIPIGTYELVLVSKSMQGMSAGKLQFKPNSTLVVQINAWQFDTHNAIVNELVNKSMHPEVTKPVEEETPIITVKPTVAFGKATIKGIVIDKAGKNPIPFASIQVKGTATATFSGTDGSFVFNNIKSGEYTIVVTGVGYERVEVKVTTDDDIKTIPLKMSSSFLEEVVVIGYGTQRKREFTASAARISTSSLFENDSNKFLQGKVAGIQVQQSSGFNFEMNSNIMIRGTNSINATNKPIYVIDGIVYDELPDNIKPDMIESIEVLKDAAATAIYGSRAANGAIIISSKGKTQREIFKDYAIWQPQLFTADDGKVKFEVTYPDNITNWQTYVLAIDKKLRVGKGLTITKAFKPVMAQLSVPQFLTVGDSVQFVGKALNYTKDDYQITTRFSLKGSTVATSNTVLPPAASVIEYYAQAVATKDTVKLGFGLETTTGFKDAEERKIPVIEQGVEETDGQFWLLPNDTVVTFQSKANTNEISIGADNKSIDILLQEIDRLKEYPYYCMEQTASKLNGLLMEKKIRTALNQPFKSERELNKLLQKLQEAQLFDGAWSWWGGPNADSYITNYIVQVLLQCRTDNPLIEDNIRNGLLYLQNQLNKQNISELLASLVTMAAAKHAMDYKPWLDMLQFDSLSLHQQWQWVFIQQQIKGSYQIELQKLLAKQQGSMLGGIYWGNETWVWYNNHMATTVLAYKVLEQEPGYQHLLNGITIYFISERKQGWWRNTVESASIVSTILPKVLAQNSAFVQPATLHISGDTTFTIEAYPTSVKLSKRIQSIGIQKQGGGMTFVSAYQKSWNQNLQAITDKFSVKTYFEKNGQSQQFIKTGERVKMIVSVTASKDAEYVMLEVPIPAGCIYGTKKQNDFNVHKEFLKNKVLIFVESMKAGTRQFEIELEPRYNGNFILNPAKAELMYFPTFFGREGMKRIAIKD
jgi:TonB-dependent SusC/RagA subfamily outer membrane receptor